MLCLQLGVSASASTASVPTASVSISGPAASVAMGQSHACALLTNGSVQCWGSGSYGQLGYGPSYLGRSSTPWPMLVPIGATVSSIAAGAYHTCVVIHITGMVRCWGDNSFGQVCNLCYYRTVSLR